MQLVFLSFGSLDISVAMMFFPLVCPSFYLVEMWLLHPRQGLFFLWHVRVQAAKVAKLKRKMKKMSPSLNARMKRC